MDDARARLGSGTKAATLRARGSCAGNSLTAPAPTSRRPYATRAVSSATSSVMTLNLVRWPGRGDHRNIGCVQAPSDQNAADPTRVVTWVKRIPVAADVGRHPRIEIHRHGIRRHTDIAEAIAIAGGDIQGAAKRDRKMGEVRQTPTCSSIASAAVWVGRAWVAEAEAVMHIVACGMRLRGAAVIKTSSLWLLTDY